MSLDYPPVALFIFRRPEQTRRVFEAIRQVRPERLFVIADGPRNEGERELCVQTRAIVESVDWPCELVTDYADSYLGLRRRLISGITWVFEQAEEAIILEDDCLADPTFFRFCAELLDRFRDEPRVMHISGNFFGQRPASPESFFFSRYPHIWGWATWRRAWQQYDGKLARWRDSNTRDRFLGSLKTSDERRFWQYVLNQTASGAINTWDYQWTFSVMSHDGLCITPTVNLVKNIGFGADASHTKESTDWLDRLEVESMRFPLVLPDAHKVDDGADAKIVRLNFKYRAPWKLAARRTFDRVFGKHAFPALQRLFR